MQHKVDLFDFTEISGFKKNFLSSYLPSVTSICKNRLLTQASYILHDYNDREKIKNMHFRQF